ANGQSAFVPVLVDPPAVTLRRCRDGVFVLSSEARGAQPLEGASVHSRKMLGEAVTDGQGVTFARVFARGDRALVVQHKDRFAVGGFGRVFEGVYVSPLERLHSRWERRG